MERRVALAIAASTAVCFTTGAIAVVDLHATSERLAPLGAMKPVAEVQGSSPEPGDVQPDPTAADVTEPQPTQTTETTVATVDPEPTSPTSAPPDPPDRGEARRREHDEHEAEDREHEAEEREHHAEEEREHGERDHEAEDD